MRSTVTHGRGIHGEVRFEYRGYRVYYLYFYGEEGRVVSSESTLSGSNFESISESE